MVDKRRWRQAARRGRDVVAVYLAIVFLLWLAHLLVLRVDPWVVGVPVAILLYAGRVLVLRRYIPGYPSASDPQAETHPATRLPALLAVGASVAGVSLLGMMVLAVGEGDGVWVVMWGGGFLCVYAWGVLFYSRRALSRHDLEWTRRIVRAQFEEVGDSTEHGQALQGLLARIDGQIDRWQP
jgi:hypothetical protein